jgi:hypothetical protein
MLRRLRFEFAGSADERHQRQVDVERVLAADVLAQLPNRLDEGETLDVADGAANLDEDDVDVVRDGANAVLDFVGDVGNDLNRATEVVAAPFFLNYRQINLARCPVVVARRGRAREALVMAKVQIRLRSVVGDIHLPVLIRTHRARVDVDVGVELLQRYLVSVSLQERADRCRSQPLSERGNDATGDQDVFDGTVGLLLHYSTGSLRFSG